MSFFDLTSTIAVQLGALRRALDSGRPQAMADELQRFYTPRELVGVGVPRGAVTRTRDRFTGWSPDDLPLLELLVEGTILRLQRRLLAEPQLSRRAER